jgi:hypothetical protein
MRNKRTKLQEAYLKRAAELREAMSNPEGTMRRLSDTVGNIHADNPKLANDVASNAMRRIGMIYQKLPKGPPMGYAGSEYDEYIPSDNAIAKFSRYASAAWNPTSVLDRMAQGKLTKEEAQALRDTSPEIYTRIQTRFIEELPKTKGKLPFNKLIQLSILFDMPADTVMNPEAIRARQQTFVQEQEQKKPSPDLSRVKQTAQNQITQSQRLQK